MSKLPQRFFPEWTAVGMVTPWWAIGWKIGDSTSRDRGTTGKVKLPDSRAVQGQGSEAELKCRSVSELPTNRELLHSWHKGVSG